MVASLGNEIEINYGLISVTVLLTASLMQGVCCDDNDQVRELTISEPQVITSPGFPKCCKPMSYILTKDVGKKYLKGVFTDVDLPPRNLLLIYGLETNGTKTPLSSARYTSGSWEHPVIFYEGKQLRIEFVHPSRQTWISKRYVGFTGTFWADDDPWRLDKPLTSCPPIGGVMEGGRVTFKNTLLPLNAQQYRFYCIWQLKTVPNSDLSVYINIEKLSGSDSHLEIHFGSNSFAPLFNSFSQINSSLKFTSPDGTQTTAEPLGF